MKFSTRGRYGTRALIRLAESKNNAPLSLKNISNDTDISVRYLEQILRKLKKAGIVKTIQGVKGGYVLSRDPEEISLEEIITILEGDDYPVNCVLEENKCDRKKECPTHKVWNEIHNCVSSILKKYTLKDLV